MQGDWEMYTNENMLIRDQLSSHPGINRVLDKVLGVAVFPSDIVTVVDDRYESARDGICVERHVCAHEQAYLQSPSSDVQREGRNDDCPCAIPYKDAA